MEGWVTKSISDVISKTKTIDPRKSPEKEFMYVDVSGVSNKTLEITENTKLLGKDAPSRARRVITKGDILFATVRPTLRRIAIVPRELDGEVCSTGYFVFQPTSELYNRYLFYFLQSDSFMGEMEKLQKGASYPAVNDSQVKSRLISYPSLPEQKRIVALLDTVFADLEQTRAKTEQNLKNARELFDSYLQQVFSQKGEGWVEGKLHTFCEKITVGHVGSMASRYKDEGVTFLRSQNIRPFHLSLEAVKFIDDEFNNELKKSQLAPGDVAIVRTGYPGTAAVIPESLPVSNCSDLVIVKTASSLSPHFLTLFLNSSFGKTLVGANLVGAAQKHFNVTAAKNVLFAAPSIHEQEEMVKSADNFRLECQRLEGIYRKKLSSIDELKKSILQKAFNGELTNAVA